jgi:hypothetical protein
MCTGKDLPDWGSLPALSVYIIDEQSVTNDRSRKNVHI